MIPVANGSKVGPQNATYLSSTTITSILKAFAEEIRVEDQTICFQHMMHAFVFLGDESEDNSHMKRASHVIHYLQAETGDIHEAFVGLQPLKTTDSSHT